MASRINRAAEAKMRRDFAKAAAAGHHCDNLVAVLVTKTQYGWSCTCTCGWSSNPKKRKLAAASLGYMHVLDAANGVVDPVLGFTGEMPAGEIDGVSLAEIVAAGE